MVNPLDGQERLEVTLDPGHDVFREGEPADALYIVQEGEIELLGAGAAQPLRLALLGPGDFFGEGSLLEGRTREATARTVSACRLLRIDAPTLTELVRHHPEAGLHMIRRLSSRLAAALAVGAASAPTPAAIAAPDARPPGPAAGVASAPRIVHESGAEFAIPPDAEVMIGRSDPASRFTPQIDLGRFVPPDAPRSLSRRHAVLSREGEQFYVRELPRVANGTWLNQRKLAPDVPTPINDGDEIAFGLVKMTFRR